MEPTEHNTLFDLTLEYIHLQDEEFTFKICRCVTRAITYSCHIPVHRPIFIVSPSIGIIWNAHQATFLQRVQIKYLLFRVQNNSSFRLTHPPHSQQLQSAIFYEHPHRPEYIHIIYMQEMSGD